ncbi:uncharacterized protein ACRADG_007235 [Cochliomyia hominivorax]
MGTQIETIQDYTDYIKCGEILKSPFRSYQHSVVLKCFKCKDVHFVLDTFVTHIQEHFKEVLLQTEHDSKTQYENVHEEEIESEGVGIDNLAIKLEEVEDPLFPVKSELDEEKPSEKDEKNSVDLETCIKDYSKEYQDEFEDALDSPEEFHPDESETDEDYIINEPKNKRKKNSNDEVQASESDTDDDDGSTKESHSKRSIKLSPIVDNFMKIKANVLTLIDLYKEQPNLWNKYSPFFRLKDKRKQHFEEITQDLNKKCSLELTWNETAEIIAHICAKHRDDFKRMHYTKKKGKKSNKKTGKYERKSVKKVKCCWFYDNLHFLRSKTIIRLQNLDSNLPDLTTEQIIKILEIYKGFPHLWNTYLIENICSNKRNDALEEMLKILESDMNIKIDINALEQYIHTIHDYFSREKRKKLGISTAEDLQNSTKNNSPNFFEHMTFLEDHEGPFNCPECNGIYTKPLCFRIHKAKHNDSIALKCSQCEQEFKTVSSYTTHAKRHLEDLQFTCKVCNMKLLRHSDLKIHLLTHTDARPYCCEICGASYRQSNSFRKHQRQHEKRFSHTCHICSKGYYTKYRYVDHMNSHMNIRSHICNICGKGFITSRALKTHSVTHEDARNHACKLCGKTFKLKIGVLQHMRTHGSKVETEKSLIL